MVAMVRIHREHLFRDEGSWLADVLIAYIVSFNLPKISDS